MEQELYCLGCMQFVSAAAVEVDDDCPLCGRQNCLVDEDGAAEFMKLMGVK